jgi:nitroreductase
MDIYEALYTTRAMRRLKADPIPTEVQARILDAAIRAPSGGNAQSWRFVLVDDSGLKAQLAPLYQAGWERLLDAGYRERGTPGDPLFSVVRSADHLAQHFAETPLLLFGFAMPDSGGSIYPALWSAMLAARAEGVGSTLTSFLNQEQDQVFAILGVPSNERWQMYGCVAMGYPSGRWGVAPRRPVHEVAGKNGWSEPLGFSVPDPLWSPDTGLRPVPELES